MEAGAEASETFEKTAAPPPPPPTRGCPLPLSRSAPFLPPLPHRRAPLEGQQWACDLVHILDPDF